MECETNSFLYCHNHTFLQESHPNSEETLTIPVQEEYFNKSIIDQYENNDVLTPTASTSSVHSSSRSSHNKMVRRRKVQEGNCILNALNRLENISNKINKPEERMDEHGEFNFFGLNVAAQLRKLPLRTALDTSSHAPGITITPV